MTSRTTPGRTHLGGLVTLLLKLAKSFKAVKVALFGASAASYAWLWSWEFAAVLMYALFVHEAGHVKAMRWMGLPTKGMYFLPFVGAAAVGGVSRSRFEEAFIAVMGPAFGLLSLVPLVFIAMADSDPRWWGYVGMAALLNLFNLLPIGFLDGGRIMRAITHSIGQKIGLAAFVVTLVGGGVFAAFTGAIMLGIIIGISALEYGWERKRLEAEPIPVMSREEILASTVAYVSLLGIFLAAILGASEFEGGDLAEMIISG